MDIEFKIGSEYEPKGHAIVYCSDSNDPEKLAAVYAVFLPIAVDISKYIPPFLISALSNITSLANITSLEELTHNMKAIMLPPIPQEVPSAEWLRDEAKKRHDDLIFCGQFDLQDTQSLLQSFYSIMMEYKELCEQAAKAQRAKGSTPALTNEDTKAINYLLMPEAELLKEVTVSLSKIRYLQEYNDTSGLKEEINTIREIGKVVSDNRYISRIAELIETDHPRSGELCAIYLDRAYALFNENYLKVDELDSRIQELE